MGDFSNTIYRNLEQSIYVFSRCYVSKPYFDGVLNRPCGAFYRSNHQSRKSKKGHGNCCWHHRHYRDLGQDYYDRNYCTDNHHYPHYEPDVVRRVLVEREEPDPVMKDGVEPEEVDEVRGLDILDHGASHARPRKDLVLNEKVRCP